MFNLDIQNIRKYFSKTKTIVYFSVQNKINFRFIVFYLSVFVQYYIQLNII